MKIRYIIAKLKSYNFSRRIRFAAQRVLRGFDDSETWCLNTSYAKWMVPRLERFIKIRVGYPARITEKEWSEILQKILAYFKVLETGCWPMPSDYNYEKFQEGEKLYEEWRHNLWW